MKPGSRVLVAASAALMLSACAESPTGPDLVPPQVPLLGNGFPDNGKATLYKMNILGHPGTPSSSMLNDEGKRLFVKLNGNTRVLLSPGPFDILDANGTDGSAAFQLPTRIRTTTE